MTTFSARYGAWAATCDTADHVTIAGPGDASEFATLGATGIVFPRHSRVTPFEVGCELSRRLLPKRFEACTGEGCVELRKGNDVRRARWLQDGRVQVYERGGYLTEVGFDGVRLSRAGDLPAWLRKALPPALLTVDAVWFGKRCPSCDATLTDVEDAFFRNVTKQFDCCRTPVGAA